MQAFGRSCPFVKGTLERPFSIPFVEMRGSVPLSLLCFDTFIDTLRYHKVFKSNLEILHTNMKYPMV